MEIGKTLYVINGKQWRQWLAKNHDKEKEIWLIYYKKHSGKQRIPYNDAVEEALCYGWIDSTAKKINDDSFAQRFTPRRNTSQWSEMNKERARKLIKQGKMMPSGLAKLEHKTRKNTKVLALPLDILEALKQDKQTWNNFERFPDSYKRIRIGWIDGARKRNEVFNQRLQYFLKMTAKNKKFGMVQ